ncbi:MAG: TetR/AcrR family transcriptional regulator [Clostridia bacterium]|nr:TetR/AcrR family transcriptional regulator [Clostridia bacterium]
MFKECKTERSAKRQRLIENTLFDMMKRRSYDDITVTDLCEELKMPRKAFYRYFDSKDCALQGLIVHTLPEYAKEQTPIAGQRVLRNELMGFFEFWKKRHELLEVLDRNGKISIVMECCLSFPVETFVSIERILPDEEPAMRDKIYRFAIGGLISIVIEWYREGFKEPASEIARLAVRVLTKPPFPALSRMGMSDI